MAVPIKEQVGRFIRKEQRCGESDAVKQAGTVTTAWFTIHGNLDRAAGIGEITSDSPVRSYAACNLLEEYDGRTRRKYDPCGFQAF